MTRSSLPAALRVGADGLYAAEAATGLIIARATWLAREDFARFIHHGAGTAAIDWEAAIGTLDVGGSPARAGTENAPPRGQPRRPGARQPRRTPLHGGCPPASVAWAFPPERASRTHDPVH